MNEINSHSHLFRTKRIRNNQKLRIRHFDTQKLVHRDVMKKPKDLELPTKLNWDQPDKLQQDWMNKIKNSSSYAAFDIFQEYGIELKDGIAKFHKGGELGLIGQIGHYKNHNGPLEEIFGKEIADEDNHNGYYKDPENQWRYYSFLKQDGNKFRVIGGVKCIGARLDELTGAR